MKLKLLILLLIIPFSLFSQTEKEMMMTEKSPEGTEFWLCFMRNHNESEDGSSPSTPLDLKLFLTSDKDANVTIEIKSINFKEKVFVRGGTVKSIKIDKLAQVRSSEIIETDRGIHVTSDNPISVYGLNRRKLTTDTFMGLPVNVIGKAYRTICYDISVSLLAEFAIVATEDSTEVTIVPTVETAGGNIPNMPFKVILNKGDVYQVAAKDKRGRCQQNCDLTGSYVEANKKISLFSGHQCAYVPTSVIACNHLVEQLPPLSSWGNHFYIGAFKKRSKYNYRVLADRPNTKVFEDSELIGILNPGQHLEREVSKSVQVTATAPVLVSQYSQGFDNGDRIGDPMMLLIPPTQQFLKKYRFATPVDGYWEHYVNVVVPTSALNSIKLNGTRVDPKKFRKLGNSRYSIGQLSVNFGTHIIEASEPFGMTSYGFGFNEDKYDAYGTLGGQSFIDYVEVPDTLGPTADGRYDKNKYKLFFRDDRNNDKGMRSIKVLKTTGIEMNVADFEEGTPLVVASFPDKDYQFDQSLLVEATDVAGNKSVFTICYYYDRNLNRNVFSINEGVQYPCSEVPPLEYGVFAGYAITSHSADFGSTGNIETPGRFSDASSSDYNLGFLASYRTSDLIRFTGRLNFTTVSGALSAPDSVSSNYRDPETGDLREFQESTSIELQGLFMGLSTGIDLMLTEELYLVGALEFELPLSSSASIKRNIVSPDNYQYANGSRSVETDQDELESLNGIGINGILGLGVRYPLTPSYHLFFEGLYRDRLTNLIDDGDWLYNKFNLNLGLRIYL